MEIRYVEGELRFAEEARVSLTLVLPAITGYFQCAGVFPKIRVVLVPNRDEFDRLVRDFLRVDIEIPSHPARIAQAQRTDMVVLSPSAYKSHSMYPFIPEDFKRLLAHELVHMVEEHLSPDIEVIPRWWSEGLAVYLSGQWRHEEDFRKPVREGIAQGTIPRFAEIQADRKLAYDWGWTIVQCVERAYGKEMVLKVVQECGDGDVFSVMGERADGFEKLWKEWLVGGGVEGVNS